MADKITLITQEEFERHINAIRTEQDLRLSLSNAFDKYNRDKNDFASIVLPSFESNLVELLEKITHDKNGWIRYWIYDLDFGRKSRRWDVTINGKPIWLVTTDNLWGLLNGEPLFDDC